MKELTQIPFHDTTIYTTADGAYVALRPVCDSLGLDFSGQLQRLQRQSWAVVGMTPTTGSDGKVYDMTTVDRRTFTMWLATIDTGRVKNEHTRELVRTYQCEAADALDKYFNEGGHEKWWDGRYDESAFWANAQGTDPVHVVRLVSATDKTFD